ncbi:MAG: transcriptional regulator, AraC family [Paenibacillaceae bacterium]|jgi:AraC-like DNA-binding protein|nr:transcriptional regulator, AraC family [Paenibacillaceae bacterium]
MAQDKFVHPAKVMRGNSFNRDETNPFFHALHKHDTVSQLLYIEEGEGIFVIDGVSYTAGAGTVLFYHRGLWHEEVSTRYPFKAIYFNFQNLQIQGLPPDYFLPADRPPLIKLGEHSAFIGDLLTKSLAEFDSHLLEAHTMANHWIGIALVQLFRIANEGFSEDNSRKPSRTAVMRARSYIEENYHNDITLERLARISHVNPYHLAHLFKEEMGVSPIQFLIRYRMEVAKRYLTTTELPLKDISELVGYESETSFHNIFKKVTGVTPGQYRRSET